MADEIEAKGGRLLKNCQVTSLTRKDNRISGVVYEHDGKPMEIEGDFVISSMPIKDLVAGLGDAVPDTIQRVASGLPYRDFVTVGLLVNKLNLENKTAIPTLGNIVPDCWICLLYTSEIPQMRHGFTGYCHRGRRTPQLC